MLAAFFLLLLTGGSTSNHTELTELPELLDDQQMSNQSSDESGSTSNHTELVIELPDDEQMSNQSSGENGESSRRICNYQDVLNHLNLTKDIDLYTLTRPVKDHKDVTEVFLYMVIYGILDVREIDQTFIPYVGIDMYWFNEHIRWDPEQFCGIEEVVVPAELLWKPDIIIEEVTEKDKAPPSPYITISFYGVVALRNDKVLISTCMMQVYSFPFDIQSCNLSFKSAVYFATQLRLDTNLNATAVTKWSREAMRTQAEWLFINMTPTEKTVENFGSNKSVIVYTITMKRRSVLYIVNFILPILFFLCLDLASFLISDSGGEKLSFKVTVLLAVTVMQLILNEILPSTSDRVPLVAVYCIGSFSLMMLSLLETVLVMYLMGKDSASQDNEADKDQSLSEVRGDKQGKVSFQQDEKKWTHCACICDVSADEAPSELLSVTKEGSSSQLTEEFRSLEKISDELKEVVKTLANSKNDERKPGYWTRVAHTVNKVFFISYVTVASLFLIVVFSIWSNAASG